MSHVIIGTGSDLPAWKLTNSDLEAMGVGYDRARSGQSLDDWAVERLGVRERYRVRPGEATSDLATRAAQRALANAGVKADDLGLIVLATFTSDHRTPNSAGLVQAKLGCGCPFIQLDAVCPGFVQALVTAAALMNYMSVEHALVVGADANSTLIAPQSFIEHCLFGDGAGAVVVKNLPGAANGLKAHYLAGAGDAQYYFCVPAGGSKEPITLEALRAERQYARWEHRAVYPMAVQKLAESARRAAERAGWSLEEVNWFVPHQAGRNVILDTAHALGQRAEKFIINLDHVGNTSSATIPLALDEVNRSGKFKPGDKLILTAVGAGLGWGALAYQW